jgi:hypothetical protein
LFIDFLLYLGDNIKTKLLFVVFAEALVTMSKIQDKKRPKLESSTGKEKKFKSEQVRKNTEFCIVLQILIVFH